MKKGENMKRNIKYCVECGSINEWIYGNSVIYSDIIKGNLYEWVLCQNSGVIYLYINGKYNNCGHIIGAVGTNISNLKQNEINELLDVKDKILE